MYSSNTFASFKDFNKQARILQTPGKNQGAKMPSNSIQIWTLLEFSMEKDCTSKKYM